MKRPLYAAISLPVRHMGCMMLCILALLGLGSQIARAQDYRAKLTVTVTDATGAAIPNASLSLQRVSTQLATPAKTGPDGTFLFQFLEPDTYKLRATADGMNPQEVTGIVIQSYSSAGITVKMKPATANAEVIVTAEPALLETESASRAFNIENKTIQSLPVINGNPVMMGNMLPGVYMRPLGIYTDPWTVTSQYLINGGLMYLNEFMIDGSPNDAQLGGNTYSYTPPNYAVKEFTVSSNNYDAQYGHTSGGVINMTTLSGTDHLHGMFWSSLRRTDWNANTYQNKFQNSINNTSANKTPFNEQTQLGFQVGGPAMIPHVLPRSNYWKPFFFFAFDHYSELLPRGLLLSYPTAKMRTGDFSELLNQTTGYQNIVIADPASTHLDTTVGSPTYGHYIRDPFPGNIIPTGRLNPIALKIAQLFPAVGSTPSGQRTGTNNLNIPNNYFDWHFRNLLGRFDLNVGDKYKMFLRPFAANFTEVSNAGGVVGAGANGGHFSRASKGFLFDFVDVINSSTVFNIRYGYTHFAVIWTSPQNQGFDLAGLGYPTTFVNQLQMPTFFGDYNFQNYNALGWFANTQNTGTYSIEGNVSKSSGRHTFHAGWDVRLTHFTFINPGFFTFNNNSDFTSTDFTNTGSQSTSGDGFATFLLGTPSNGTTAINASEFISTWYLAPYIQDDWRVTPRLTVNMGLRYDILTGPVDKYDALNVGFDPNVPNAVQAQIPSSAINILPQAGNLTGGLLFANVNGNSRSPVATVYHNIQPRIGFSWQPIDRMVVRGGYGLFYTNFQNNNFLQQVGFSQSTALTTSNDGGMTPINNVLNNPYPTGLIQPSGSSLGTLTGIGQAISSFNRSFKIPQANEFSFGIQYRLFRNGVLDASYVGNRVLGYGVAYDANLPPWNFLQTCDEVYASGKNSNCTATGTNPFKGISAFKGTTYYTAASISEFNLNRPHPQFQAVTIGGLNRARDWYDGLQVDYTQRMTHGVSFSASYTWSKQLERAGWLNQALNIMQKSPYAQGLPQVFKVHGVFELPFGRDRLVNFGGGRVADAIAGGWSFSPSFTMQSGEPAALPANAYPLPHNKFLKPDWSATRVKGWNNCVLNKINGVISIPGGSTGATAQRCGTDMSQYDWVQVPVLTNEQASPSNSSVLRMKPMIISDAAIEKAFRIREGINASVRLQATNALNHFNLLTARFDTNPNDGANFGTVVPGQTPTADSPPRNVNIQFHVTF